LAKRAFADGASEAIDGHSGNRQLALYNLQIAFA
jgi:hypothetical protein